MNTKYRKETRQKEILRDAKEYFYQSFQWTKKDKKMFLIKMYLIQMYLVKMYLIKTYLIKMYLIKIYLIKIYLIKM